MKKILFAILMMAPMALSAQDNTWEKVDTQNSNTNPDQKYMAGAVPEENGHVVFSTTIEAPGKSAAQVYDICKKYMTSMTKEANQFEQSRIALADSATHKVLGNYQEWLVFKSTALVLDRTRMMYNLMAECSDGKAVITMTRIYYLYDEERTPTTFVAEEWITDKYGLNKKQTKLSRVSGKFRRKTIDRKDYLFNKFASLLK